MGLHHRFDHVGNEPSAHGRYAAQYGGAIRDSFGYDPQHEPNIARYAAVATSHVPRNDPRNDSSPSDGHGTQHESNHGSPYDPKPHDVVRCGNVDESLHGTTTTAAAATTAAATGASAERGHGSRTGSRNVQCGDGFASGNVISVWSQCEQARKYAE